MAEKELARLLKRKLEDSGSLADFFNSIHNICEGQEGVIMATGPTISKYSDEQYHDFLEGKSVFSIKQTFNKLPEHTDVHFFNCCNLPKEKDYIGYRYDEHKPFVVADSNFHNGGGRWPSDQFMHLFFKIPMPQNGLIDGSVLWNSHRLEDALLENGLERPCGPGIFFDVALFFVLHLGFKEVYTIGWDYASDDSKYGHFYADGAKANHSQVHVPSVAMENEVKKTIEFTGVVADWLISKGVSLKVVGGISEVSKKFERIEI